MACARRSSRRTEHPCDPGAREAGDRGDQRRVCRCRALARVRVRRSHRVDQASFVPGFIGIGLIPDAGGSWFIHRLLGFSRAFEWMVSNRRLSAEEALGWGLVSDVRPADRFEEGGRRPLVRGAADAWRR